MCVRKDTRISVPIIDEILFKIYLVWIIKYQYGYERSVMIIYYRLLKNAPPFWKK